MHRESRNWDKQEIPGSGLSMRGYILSYPRLQENICQLRVLNRGDHYFCVLSTPLRVTMLLLGCVCVCVCVCGGGGGVQPCSRLLFFPHPSPSLPILVTVSSSVSQCVFFCQPVCLSVCHSVCLSLYLHLSLPSFET